MILAMKILLTVFFAYRILKIIKQTNEGIKNGESVGVAVIAFLVVLGLYVFFIVGIWVWL